jgi:hypothetical protein
MFMNPTSVPEVGAVEPIDTDNVSGVTPLVGVTISQLLLEKADTVKFAGPPDDVICSACVGADAPLKVSCGGKAVSELLCARAVSIEHSRAGSRTARRNQDICVVFTIFS